MKNQVLKINNYFFLAILLAISLFLLSGCGEATNKVCVNSIEISKKNLYLAEGQTTVISAQVYPFNASNQKVDWISTNEDIAKIENGFVTAVKNGTAQIEVFSEEGGYKDTCNVLVSTIEENLELNKYDNINMPLKNSTDNVKSNYPIKKVASLNSENILKIETNQIKQFLTDAISSLGLEIGQSITSLNKEKEMLSTNLKDFVGQGQNEYFNTFAKVGEEILTSMINIKQNALFALQNTRDNLKNNEYTIKNKNVNGVTFVIIRK